MEKHPLVESIDWQKYKNFAAFLAQESGKVITPFFNNSELSVEIKSDNSPVTVADRNAEQVMRDHIRRVFPEHGVVGEEFGSENESAEFVWFLDPIDGTFSFVHGCPLFATLICLVHRGNPAIGVIHQPILDLLCVGDNLQTTLNGKKVEMRAQGQLSKATLLATDIGSIERHKSYSAFEQLRRRVKSFRTWGDAYGYLLLAGGHADIMLDPIMKQWDLMALIPVIRGAGGVISTWEGKSPVAGNSCVAANKQLHQKVIDLLNSGTQ